MATNGNDQRQQIGVDGNRHFFLGGENAKNQTEHRKFWNRWWPKGQKHGRFLDLKKIDIDIDTKGSVEWLVEFQTRVFCRQLVPQHSTIDATVPSIPIDPRLANRPQ